MKIRMVAWTLMIIVGANTAAFGQDERVSFEAVAADVVLARPLWLVATAVGTGLFIATLPVSVLSRSVNQTAKALVVRPARATFTRPLGDFSTVE